MLLGLSLVPSLFRGGATYISSSGVIAKVPGDLGWTGNRETPLVLSVLVFEDMAMAVILPVLGAIAFGGTLVGAAVAVGVALPRLSGIAAGYVLPTAIVGPAAAKPTTRLPASRPASSAQH